MPHVAPFDGLLYEPALVGDLSLVTAPPYDVIEAHDLASFRDASPYNIVRVDLGHDETAAPGHQYTAAATTLRGWRERGILAPAGTPAAYPYEMDFTYRGSRRTVRGVILEVGLEPLGGAIVPHEETMAAPVQDRLALLRATRTNLSPIYAICRAEAGGPPLGGRTARAPDRELTDEEGAVHRLWVEPEGGDLAAWYADRMLMIADGHHRYRTALAFQEEMRVQRGRGAWDAVMMLLVDSAAEDPPVLPIHRLLRVDPVPEVPGQRVHDLAEVLRWLVDDDLRFGAAFRFRGEVIHLIGRLEGEPPTVLALHRGVIDPMPGVREVRFVPDAVTAEDAVRAGAADLALFLPPARAENVRSVVEAGGTLPQKSTYFWPKPRTGLVIRPLD